MTILPKKKVNKDPAPGHVSDGSGSESEGGLPTAASPTGSTHDLEDKGHYGYHHYSPTPDLYRHFSSSGDSSPELPVLSKGHYRRGPGGRTTTPSPQHSGYNSAEEHDCQRNIYVDLKKEQVFEDSMKRDRGLVVNKMRPDGACLFRAVADQVYGDQDMHAVVRNHCLDYMIKNTDYFSQFVTEDFEHYISRKRSDRCYGNYLEMQAIAEMYNRCIEVYQYSTEPINTFFGIYKTDNPPIRLSYHGRIHYNSVVDPYEPTVGVGLGLAGFKPGLADKNLMSEARKESEIFHLEQTMFQDKLRTSDWDATFEAIEQAVSQESYLLWLKEQETKSVNNGGPSRLQNDIHRSLSSPLPPLTTPTVSSHQHTSPSYHTTWKPLTFVSQRARSRSRSSSRSNSKSPQTGRRSPSSTHNSTHNSPTRSGRTSPRISGRNSPRSGISSPNHTLNHTSPRSSPKPSRSSCGNDDDLSSSLRQLTPPLLLHTPPTKTEEVTNNNSHRPHELLEVTQSPTSRTHSKTSPPAKNSVDFESGRVQSPLPFEYSSFLDLPPSAFGLLEWEGDRELAAVLAASQQEYLDSLKPAPPNSRGAESL